MKKAAIILCLLVTISLVSYYSFSQKQTNKPAAKATNKTAGQTSKSKVVISKADIEEGKNLVAKSDCLACHQLEVKVVGPSYKMVADKYPATNENINKLANKVIKGGAGEWGQIPMNPHENLKLEDAKTMVKYVLSLKAS